MKIDSLTLPEYRDIRSETIQKLLEHIGITKTAMFIKEELYNKSDYICIKEDIFNNQSIEDLYTEIKKEYK